MNKPLELGEEDEPQDYVTCKCEVCGWRDDFRVNDLNIEQCTDGFCEPCDQPRIFVLE